MSTDLHTFFMASALNLAEKGRFSVSPNPLVGCLIVKNGQIIGQGYHQRAGEAHAEIIALEQAGAAALGATAYVTLEPCCHHGKTGPCTTALIQAGIKTVYIAVSDPNPLVAGHGIQLLQAAGIETHVGVLAQEAIQLNEIFFHFITQKRPFVIAKWAMSLDGKTSTHPSDSRHISSQESQQAAHALRQQVDAILVGAKTAIHDNPSLTVRLTPEGVTPKHPIRIVLASQGQLPTYLKLFDATMPAKTIIAVTDKADSLWCKQMQSANTEIWVLPQNADGQVDLFSLLTALGKQNISSLLVEGGMTVHDSFFRANLVNKVHVYIAPVIIGSLSQKKQLTQFTCTPSHRDFLCVAHYNKDLNYV